MDRKKELKKQYLMSKPDMGVFAVHCKVTDAFYVGVSKNLKGSFNGIKFQLGFGSYINKELQKEWDKHGEDAFDFFVLEQLEYDKDETKTDYSEDLETLRELAKSKIAGVVYNLP